MSGPFWQCERALGHWRHGEGEPRSGRLELTSKGLALEGSGSNCSTVETLAYGDLRQVRVGRSASDRIGGRQTLVIERRAGEPIRVAAVVYAGIISELAEHLGPYSERSRS